MPTRQQLSLSTGQQTLLAKLLLLEIQSIIFQWIDGKPPTVTQWYRETFKVFPMERLSATLKGNDNSFYNVWQPFIDYLPDDIVDLLQKGRPCFVFTNRHLFSHYYYYYYYYFLFTFYVLLSYSLLLTTCVYMNTTHECLVIYLLLLILQYLCCLSCLL
jgi:hypothetical protein